MLWIQEADCNVKEVGASTLYRMHRATRFYQCSFQAARPPLFGRALMLVEVRPSNEARLRAAFREHRTKVGVLPILSFSSCRDGMMGTVL